MSSTQQMLGCICYKTNEEQHWVVGQVGSAEKHKKEGKKKKQSFTLKFKLLYI